jgi:hypothetical protein
MDEVFKQLRFTIERDGKRYCDAIVLPEDEFDKLSKEDIEKTKEERFTNWLTVISTPAPELSKEEQLAQTEEQLKAIEEQKVQLTSQKATLEAAIASKPKPIKDVLSEDIGG